MRIRQRPALVAWPDCATSKGSLILDSTQSSDGVITKPSSKSVPQTIDGLRRLMADRGFTVFNVIDHSGVAERAGCADARLETRHVREAGGGRGGDGRGAACCAGYPTQGAGLGGRNGTVSVSYNSPGFLAGRHHLEGELRAPFDAVESIVEALGE
jgi:hypothetical protein